MQCFIFITLFKSLKYSCKLLSFPPLYRAWNWTSKIRSNLPKDLQLFDFCFQLLLKHFSQTSLVTSLLRWIIFFSGRMACKILVPQTRGWTQALGSETQSPNNWTSREFPEVKCKERKLTIWKFNSVTLNIFSMLCNHHLYFRNSLITLKGDPVLIKLWFSFSSFPQPLAITGNTFWPLNLPILGISNEWNHPICAFSCLASFSMFSIFIHIITFIRSTSFLWLKNIALYGYTTFCLSIKPLMDFWAICEQCY